MQRRDFLLASAATAAALPAAPLLASAAAARDAAPNAGGRDYYELRRYQLRGGAEPRLLNDYLRAAFIPAANRAGLAPIGVFDQLIGPGGPATYVLIPAPALEKWAGLDAALRADAAYMNAARPFLEAPASAPAFERMESSLLLAFPGRPGVTPPPGGTTAPRVFELRSYESPSVRDHRRKIEMFHSGEFEIFARAGFHPVFYGDALIGDRLPKLTYLLAFDRLEDRDRLWSAFSSDPQWRRLTADPRFAFEPIVDVIDNRILAPARFSQI